MRFTIASLVVLLGLMLGATAMAGHHETDEGAATERPPIEASPPADTDVAAPAAPVIPADVVPVEGTDSAADQ